MVRVLITENIESAFSAVKRFSATGRPGETFTNREHFQHYGITSRPPVGAEGIALQAGSSVILIASDDRRYRLKLDNDGEVAIYTNEGDYIHFKKGRKIEVNCGGTVTINASDIELGGVTGLNKLIDDRFEAIYNAHTHPVSGASTGAPVILIGSTLPKVPVSTSVVKAK